MYQNRRRRPLHRGCGLKLFSVDCWSMHSESPSSQRVWIEIWLTVDFFRMVKVALFTEGVDWNWHRTRPNYCSQLSPSSQRVWIEIFFCLVALRAKSVALFTEGVDWNKNWSDTKMKIKNVALFTEGVDWNGYTQPIRYTINCRPLHRGCGLKSGNSSITAIPLSSPSSQRVWIEIGGV